GCLLSHDASSSSPESHDNLLGAPGAWLAQELYQGLGLTAYLFLAGWLVLGLLLLARRRLVAWFLRLAGWIILVPAAAALADRLRLADMSPSGCGAGGSIGAWVNLELADRWSDSEQLLILAGAMAVGLLLAMGSLLFSAVCSLGRSLAQRRRPVSRPVEMR